MKHLALVMMVCAAALAGCVADGGVDASETEQSSTTTYVDILDFSKTDQGQWYDLIHNLNAQFDQVCGDTFCGSDFGDLQSMDFTCAITKSTGNVKSCMWTFGGSWHLVAPQGGAQQITASTFQCPVPMKGTLSQLSDTITAPGTDDAIQRPLPGMTTSAYDALGGCLP